jgi:glucan phosphoethanolaminetransferase (alkaline phosphatase superfamily)
LQTLTSSFFPSSGKRSLALVCAGFAIVGQFAILGEAFRYTARSPHDVRTFVDMVTSTASMVVFVRLATNSRRRALLAIACSTLIVSNILVFRYYRTPIDIQVMASALAAKHDVRPVVARIMPVLVTSVAALAALEWVLLEFLHRQRGARLGAHTPLALMCACLGGFFGHAPRFATPEVRAIHALFALKGTRDAPRGVAVTLPSIYSEREQLPNVLFVLSESVRASDYRSTSASPTTPSTASLTAARFDFTQMRAISSYTALSVSALFTGHPQAGTRDVIRRSPSLFDFARATRDTAGRTFSVAYFSSQSKSVFETDEMHASAQTFITVESLRGHDVEDDPDYATMPLDREIVDTFEQALPKLSKPTFAVLHFSGTHAPYFVDEADSPFQPSAHVVTWSGLTKLHNAYQNAIVEQDRSLARAVRAFLAHSEGQPWLIVFTSDHGEAFGEQGAIHHGQNLSDVQLHVPAWILDGGHALSDEQRKALQEHHGRWVTHLDVVPTLLDAIGIWNNSAVADFRSHMSGKSLLRAYEFREPIPITNCTSMFPCPVNTWGILANERKLVARVYDRDWMCFDHDGSGERLVNGNDTACDGLRRLSREAFPTLPNGAPNRP